MRPHLTHILFLACLFLNNTLQAQAPQTLLQAYQHLEEVNAQWQHHLDAAPDQTIQFNTDQERIQYHLELVEQYLRANPPQHLSAEALQQRQELLDVLQSYAAAKQFPKNHYHPVRQPYFVDREGTHCAVGYLMARSGATDLVAQVHEQYNYDYLLDMPQEGIIAWADTHGFTVDELAWIQPGYPPSTPFDPIGAGTNGPIRDFFHPGGNHGLYFTGDFTTVDDMPCAGVGIYENGTLQCVGEGLAGTLADVVYQSNIEGSRLLVAGAIEMNGNVWPLAIYENDTWSYIDIPSRPGATASMMYGVFWGSEVQLAINTPGQPNTQEVWEYTGAGTWKLIGEVAGQVHDMVSSGVGIIYVGHFDEFTGYLQNGSSATVAANNVAIYYGDTWTGLQEEISDTILVVKEYGNAIYFGGTCSASDTGDPTCLTRYQNGSMQTLLYRSQFTVATESWIEDILPNNDVLILAGRFDFYPIVGDYGSNLGLYYLSSNSPDILAILDEPVHTLAKYQNEIYLGGSFTFNTVGQQTLPHLAKIDGTPESIWETPENRQVQVFPNPVSQNATIKGIEGPFQYQIFNPAGQLLQTGQSTNQEVSMDALPNGLYLLQIATETQQHSFKLVKQ